LYLSEEHDVVALHQLPLDVATESVIYGDSAFTDYDLEDIAMDAEAIGLMIQRKYNSKRPDAPWIRFIKEQMRKRIETSISCIKNSFSQKHSCCNRQRIIIESCVIYSSLYL
jgi:hypothetical protein